MRRREFITLTGASVAWPLAALAQQPGRTYRLGCLLPLTHDAPINIAFFDELRRRGFIEGLNLTVEYRAYGLHVDLISEYAAELVNARVDVIVTAGDVATIRAAQQATKTIPILAMTGDLIGLGLVASQARPDGNTTGVNIFAIELDGKRQEILIEAVPGLRRMAFLADANFETVATLEALQEAARARNIDLSIHRIAKGEEITAAIDAAKASGAEGLNFSASPLFFTYRQLIIDRVAALRLPAIYEWPETAEEGGLAAYGPRLSQLFVEVMTQQLVKLFHGIKVADIPVEQSAKFELVINLKTANALGLTVSPTLLARADCSDAVAGCEYREGAQGRRSADAALAEEDRMMTREQIKVGTQIAARMAELRRLAERTARDYEADSAAADNSLPAEHRRLRRMLFAIAAAHRGRKGAR